MIIFSLTSSVDACFVQSFSFESLQKLKNLTDLPLIYLFNTGSFNFLPTEDRPRPNDENFSWKSWGFWAEIKKICYGVGPSKSLIAVSSGRKIKFLSDLVEGEINFWFKFSFNFDKVHMQITYAFIPIHSGTKMNFSISTMKLTLTKAWLEN